MIGNHRLYQAVVALATSRGGVRDRVVMAMEIIHPLTALEFPNQPELWARICKLRHQTDFKGPVISRTDGSTVVGSYKNTARNRTNKTYEPFAKEIFDIWFLTL